jgi:hypothetical protein
MISMSKSVSLAVKVSTKTEISPDEKQVSFAV